MNEVPFKEYQVWFAWDLPRNPDNVVLVEHNGPCEAAEKFCKDRITMFVKLTMTFAAGGPFTVEEKERKDLLGR